VSRLADEAGPDGLTIRDVRDHMDERAFGLFILILTIPCLVPALYGVPQVLGVPIILLAAQVLIGRQEPWLPEGRAPTPRAQGLARPHGRLRFQANGLVRAAIAAAPGVARDRAGERLAALFMILATVTIVLPMTNTVPSWRWRCFRWGLIQRDGMFVALGIGRRRSLGRAADRRGGRLLPGRNLGGAVGGAASRARPRRLQGLSPERCLA
jgi:hypothetical protein